MLRAFLAAGLAVSSVPVSAQPWDGAGPMLASFYNEAMSIPKGWNLAYGGRDQDVEVFIFETDFDQFPMTAFIQPDSQLRRLLCGDETPRGWIAQGMRARADQRVKEGGKVKLRKGTTVLSRC